MNEKIMQKGRSTIEVIGYMAAVMAVVAGVGKTISGVYDQHKMSMASIQVSDLATNITKIGAVESDYETIIKGLQDAIKGCEGLTDNQKETCEKEYAKMIPSSFRIRQRSDSSSPELFHALGGFASVNAMLNSNGSYSFPGFAIIFNNLSREQCIELGSKNWSTNKVVSLTKIGIGNTENKKLSEDGSSSADTSNLTSMNKLPTRAQLTGKDENDKPAWCKDNNNNYIFWHFR